MKQKLGKCFVIGVPIGNYEDISNRALQILDNCDLILCEDTRETGKMLMHYGKSIELISYMGSFEKAKQKSMQFINSGKNVALVSDRGMPCISDPGDVFINLFRQHEVEIDIAPGPSAVTAAFALSGFSGGFVFHGFLPRKKGQILNVIDRIINLKYNLIFFESPKRVKETLLILSEKLAQKDAVVVREITKTFQQVKKGKIEDLAKHDYMGECVIIISK